MAFIVYMCQRCGKRFSAKGYCQDHIIVEHSSGARLCSNCKKKFPDDVSLADHMTAHATDSHSCNICGELCKTVFALFVHLTTCHKYKGNFVCDICQKTFSDKQSVHQHMLLTHCKKIPSMIHTAELCCTIHSSLSFPDEDLLLDPLIPRDIFEKYFQALSGEHSKRVEVQGIDARSDGPKFNELLPQSIKVTRPVRLAISKQVEPHRDEVELVDDSPEARVQFPSRLLDTCDPECELNSAVLEHSATDHDASSLGGRVDATQPESVPEYNQYQSHFSTLVNLPYDEDKYICAACGMEFEDPIIYGQSHLPLDIPF